jgi:hypothetical protein
VLRTRLCIFNANRPAEGVPQVDDVGDGYCHYKGFPVERKLNEVFDDGKRLAVDTEQYGHFDHGYALTIHKSQGVTVDLAYVLAAQSMHAELAYVAMTRHKNSLVIAASITDFADGEAMVRSLLRPLASSPTSTLSASPMSPVETPRRYIQGNAADTRGDFRM